MFTMLQLGSIQLIIDVAFGAMLPILLGILQYYMHVWGGE